MFKMIASVRNIRLLIEAALLMAALVGLLSRSTPTEAAPVGRASQAEIQTSAYDWFACNNVIDVAVFDNRVHVHCAATTPLNGQPALPAAIRWFATSTVDSSSSSRYLSLFQTSLLSGKVLDLYLNPDNLTGDAWGCNAGDCRTIAGAKVNQ